MNKTIFQCFPEHYLENESWFLIPMWAKILLIFNYENKRLWKLSQIVSVLEQIAKFTPWQLLKVQESFSHQSLLWTTSQSKLIKFTKFDYHKAWYFSTNLNTYFKSFMPTCQYCHTNLEKTARCVRPIWILCASPILFSNFPSF